MDPAERYSPEARQAFLDARCGDDPEIRGHSIEYRINAEDGGRNWRRVEDFPNVPKWAYVSDVVASPIDANVIFVTLNNWQRGDYKPYVVRSNDRGRTWTNITGDLPALHDAWSIAQDHIAPNLLFVGTEFGLFFTVDGGSHWVKLKGGMPPAQVTHGPQDSLRLVEAGHGKGQGGHELDLLLAQVSPEHVPQGGVELEQAGVEQVGGDAGDGLDILKAGLDESDLLGIHVSFSWM